MPLVGPPSAPQRPPDRPFVPGRLNFFVIHNASPLFWGPFFIRVSRGGMESHSAPTHPRRSLERMLYAKSR